jgi:signal transduction histidine kinase
MGIEAVDLSADRCAPAPAWGEPTRGWSATSRIESIRTWIASGRLSQSRMMKLGALTGGAVALLALEFVVPVGGRAPGLRAALESLITLLALLGALALAAQFGHTRRLRDLVLLGALILFALVELWFGVRPVALDVDSGGQFDAATQLGQLLVAAAIAAAAFTPSDRMVVGYRRPLAITAVISLGALGAVELGAWLAAGHLVSVANHSVFGIHGAVAQPLALLVVLVTSALLACAAVRFAHRGDVERDSAMSVVAGALVLMAVARLYFLAVPSLPGAWVSPIQGLWLLAMVLMMAAIICQERAVRAGIVRAAKIAERRRVACDLHDGLAQDLAFIASHGAWMTAELGAEHPITIAASRALAISREAISDLSDGRSETAGEALAAIAHELGARYAMSIAVEADRAVDLDSNTREHLLRIAREAIANAGRHGHARNVLVSLGHRTGGLVLRIRDDGCGTRGRSASAVPEGFGIRSMRERAAALGGIMTVRERNGGGTELEVMLPQ